MIKSYAGIGSRKTPDAVCEAMTTAAASLEDLGWILRTGGANGADAAFFKGLSAPEDPEHLELYIPWEGFQGFTCKDASVHTLSGLPDEIQTGSMEIAAQYHPAWDQLSGSVRHLMARNTLQILGASLEDPVKFVLCWTPNGSGSGGTGQAIRLATNLGIPVIDLGKTSIDEAGEQISEILNKV